MSKKASSWRYVLVSVGLALGCSAHADDDALQSVQQHLDKVPDSGFIPYPIQVDPVTEEPVLGPDGAFLPAWDGTQADLMAADAYAQCAMDSSYFNAYASESFGADREGNDEYLQYLVMKMSQADCTADPGTAGIAEDWLRNREQANCNVDPRSGKLAIVEAPNRGEDPPYDSFYDFGQTWGITADSTIFETARATAGRELEYADLNLCMAQRLREQLNGGQSLFTPTSDQAQILAVIRERAQLAVVFYSMLAKVFFNPSLGPSSIDAADYEFLVLIRRWIDGADNATKQRIAEDFGTAVRLHVQSVHELAALLEREAATRPVNDVGFDRADRDWGAGQPRLRLLNLLYGGDPIGSPEFPYPAGRGRGGVGVLDPVPAYVSEDMRDPRLRTLLGLSRAADALHVKVRVESGENVGFDEVESGESVYRRVEVALRTHACELATPADPACDPETIETELPSLDDVNEYLLWQEHHIEPRHAISLVKAFAEAFGELVDEGAFQQNDGKLHLLGVHETETIEGEPWIHIDPEFTTGAFTGHELLADFADGGLFVPTTISAGVDARSQGFIAAGRPANWAGLRGLGAVQALILAREAVAQGPASASMGPFLDTAEAIFEELERAVGWRQVVVRRQTSVSNVSCTYGDYEPGATCQVLSPSFDRYDVEVLTPTEDPLDQLTRAPMSPQLHTLAVDPDTVGFDGTDRADLDGVSPVSMATQNLTGFAADYQRRSVSYTNSFTGRVLLLRGDDPEGPEGQQAYVTIASEAPSNIYATSFGGALHGLAERAMRVLPYDWSRPASDAFGLPVDWVPPADASLVGGSPGEPSYEYYLRKAKEASQEATAAVQTAIDNLVQESVQTVELEAAEARASNISEIETRALCGESESCEVTLASWRPSVRNCSPDGNGDAVTDLALDKCNDMRDQVVAQLPWLNVAGQVLNATTGVAPTFSEFEGGETQRILIRQWNAKRSLERLVSSAVDLAITGGREIDAAEAALVDAAQAKTWADADVTAQIDLLDDGIDEIETLKQEMVDAQNEITTKTGQAVAVAERECSDAAYEGARQAGKSFADANEPVVTSDQAAFTWNVRYTEDGRSWSPGPLFAQSDRCQAATDEANIANALAEPAKQTLQLKIEDLIARSETLDSSQRTALTERRKAAEATFQAAKAGARAARQASWTQMGAQLTQVQQATGELLAAGAELSQARLRTEATIATATLERDLAQKLADTRFGLRRKFRSYDMWRARALLESARRLAVAARRAIEARFVVDLSELDAPQAFVAAPSVWADEVYGTDLNAPSVVGLTVAPQIEDAVSPNHLLDYVENLERFVQGYTVTYPTSVAVPDTEIISISGPEMTEKVDENGVISEIVSGASLGWTFYCPETRAWFPHPGTGEVPLEHRLDELCEGAQPTRARYNFSLDPWGRLNRALRSGSLEQRHNVRWGRVALNLVGTGIRDCQRAASPEGCFSESFLRFQLVHSGPAWSTNHAQQWRSFDLPTAFIEEGKALASEEWLDPVANSWSSAFVSNVARGELLGRPVNGGYELILELGPEVRLERIEQVQLLVETDYWVRQQ